MAVADLSKTDSQKNSDVVDAITLTLEELEKELSIYPQEIVTKIINTVKEGKLIFKKW